MADLIGTQQQTLPANHFFIWVTKSRFEDFRGHLAHLNESETNRATYLIKERRSHANDSINLGKEWIEVVNSLLFRVAVESDKFTVSRRYEILFLRLKMII